MSFDLCRETSRGVLTDLAATDQKIGVDSKIVAPTNDGKTILDQKFKQFNNYVKDTSVRTIMEGQRNVFSGSVPEEGDLLTSATLVLQPILDATTPISGNAGPTTFIDFVKDVEIRINGQCIQHLDPTDFDVPLKGINSDSTQAQREGYERLINMQNGAPYYLPLNVFFAKKNNGYPLFESQYPIEVRVEFQNTPGSYFNNASKWEDAFELTLLTTQVYLNDDERATLGKDGKNKKREMLLLQRDSTTYNVKNADSKFRVKLESNLPMRVLKIAGDRIQSNTLVRFLVNGHIRFEHFAKNLQTMHLLEDHGISYYERRRWAANKNAGVRYHFGDPCTMGPKGRINLTQLDNPTVEIVNLKAAVAGGSSAITVMTESYNVLDWNNGKSFLRLHKSR